jgi:hypothetical protein
MDVYAMFGWVFLAAVLVAIPMAMVVHYERAYRRETRRRLVEMNRMHEWQERCERLDGRDGGLWVPPRKVPEQFRPSARKTE